ncbi:hypothetical protein KC19_10G014200 [Ceratodon purpureus]|uniref:Glucose/galactose transporter n=1 Tax=Ceratodon purpureus TaxID=3225 RepID=A0A8T0GGV1_CERPU|nr:hypothetical protein KC19_10G014200 [Ceratodon purpureus]
MSTDFVVTRLLLDCRCAKSSNPSVPELVSKVTWYSIGASKRAIMAGGAPVGKMAVRNMPTGRQLWFPLALVTSLFFLWGFAYGLLDVLNKHFQEVLNLSKMKSTGLQVAYFGAYIVFPPLVGQPIVRRFGYKVSIITGLMLYVVGALCFWPCAQYETFPGFVAATFVIACGISNLEVAANTYVTVLGSAKTATFRLNLSQSFNGLGSFIGPLIASKFFFSAEHSGDLDSVKFTYLGIACGVFVVAVLFLFVTLPEVSDEDMEQESDLPTKPLLKQPHFLGGVLAQWLYVGAQVTVATFFINLANEDGIKSDSKASQLLSYSLILFTVGRFFSTFLLKFLQPRYILGVYAILCTTLCALSAGVKGLGGTVCVMVLFFFMSCMYPTIFTLALQDLGGNTKRAGTFVVMGVGGGAIFPPIQGAIADKASTKISQIVPTVGFAYLIFYAFMLAKGPSPPPSDDVEAKWNDHGEPNYK